MLILDDSFVLVSAVVSNPSAIDKNFKSLLQISSNRRNPEPPYFLNRVFRRFLEDEGLQ